MTQYEIAKRLGVTEQAVSKWYTGKNLPSTKNLVVLSKLLGKDVETLLNELSKKKQAKSAK